MTHQYSVEQLPKQLERIIQEVEKSGSAQITRQGERVAVILSAAEYDRLLHEKLGFGEALEQFRQEYNVVSDL
ncbi:MAG: type II toxin-antitoxin system prevent-host-death family antitoxin [Rhizonema sp. PD38]|nr:type II toxin-antitoxin system prevent-host-death family antitoxin [Rhizonema sp. PD38]